MNAREPAVESKWAGAALALMSALAGSLPVLLLSPLLTVYILGNVLALGLVPATPLLQLALWAGKIGGWRFLLRLFLGWIAGISSFMLIMYSLKDIEFRDFNLLFSQRFTWLHFVIVGAPGGCAGAIWGCSLGPRRFAVVGAVAGCLYPAGSVFASHCCSVGIVSHELEGWLLGAGLVSPMLLLSPWVGWRLPIVPPDGAVVLRRVVATGVTILATVLLGLGFLYAAQRPSALKVRRVEMKVPAGAVDQERAGGKAERPVWALATSGWWGIPRVVSPPGSSAILLAGAVYQIDPDEKHYLEIRGTELFRGMALRADGALYCACKGTVFAVKSGRKIWSREINGPILDLHTDTAGNVTAIMEGEIYSWDPEGHARWRSAEKRTEYGWWRGVMDQNGSIYVASFTARNVLAVSPSGHVMWWQDTGISHSSFIAEPNAFQITPGPEAMLIIGSEDGCVMMDLGGTIKHASKEPFKLFGCDDKACYGATTNGVVMKMDKDGARQVLYRSNSPLVGEPILGSADTIYILTLGKVTSINAKGEVLTQFSVSPETLHLLAHTPKRLYAATASHVIALEKE